MTKRIKLHSYKLWPARRHLRLSGRRLICALLCLIASAAAQGSDELGEALQRSDEIRSSSPGQFSAMLRKLELRRTDMSAAEQDYLSYLLAYEHSFNGRLEKARSIYQELVQSSAVLEIRFRALTSLVNTNAIKREWSQGAENLRQTLQLLPQIKDDGFYVHGLAVAAVFYNLLGQYQQGLHFATRLREKGHNDGRSLCFANQLSLQALFGLKRIEATDKAFAQALNICREANEPVGASAILSYQAELYINEGKPQQALELLLHQLPQMESTRYAPMIASYYSLLAEAYWRTDEPELAKKFAIQAVAGGAEAGKGDPSIRAFRVLYQYYRQSGDLGAALDAYIQYSEADKAFLDEIRAKTLAFQLAEHQSVEQKNRIALLDEQNKLLKVKQQLAETESHNHKLLIAALFCVITLLLTWGYQSWKTQKRLRELAEFDCLTGIFSRGHFTQVGLSALEYCKLQQLPVSCIMLDLDNFKRINDTKGHKTGDWALREVARIARNLCNGKEILGRIGGEEFCLLMPETRIDKAIAFAEILRELLEQADTSDSGHSFTLTASFGVSEAAISGYQLEALLADTDKAMYQAKKNGRNQVCSAADIP